MVHVRAVPAFKDNYIWLLCGADDTAEPRPAAIVDPGDALPVLRAVDELRLAPAAILITHHHSDHIGGIAQLRARFDVPVYGPAREAIPGVTHPLRQGERVALPGFPVLEAIDVPGHTAGHIAYFGERLLFCGDTLFAGGCGRLFEGTAAQLHASLQRLALLSDDTWIYCAHEYTLDNLLFAQTVEPDNPVLQDRLRQTRLLRQQDRPTVPTELGMEKRSNPFLRCHLPSIAAAVARYAGHPLAPGIETFAALRSWKDGWRA